MGVTVLFQQAGGFWLRSKQDPSAVGGANKSIFLGLEINSTWNPDSLDGKLANLTSALDTYGFALQRVTTGARAGWWTIRRSNTSSQDILAFAADQKNQTPVALWAPQGIRLGSTQKVVDDTLINSIEARLAALETNS